MSATRYVFEGKPSTLRPQVPIVTINGAPVNFRLDPDGQPRQLNWGYKGGGPRCLAQAITRQITNGVQDYQLQEVILDHVVAVLPQRQPWVITDQDIAMVVLTKGGHEIWAQCKKYFV